MIDKCEECGCPQPLCAEEFCEEESIHYKGCVCLRPDAPKMVTSLRNLLLSDIRNFEKIIEDYKLAIAEARDCYNTTVLDEVYWCRWDCLFMRLVTAI